MDWNSPQDINRYHAFYHDLLPTVNDPVNAHSQAVNMVAIYNQTFVMPDNPDV